MRSPIATGPSALSSQTTSSTAMVPVDIGSAFELWLCHLGMELPDDVLASLADSERRKAARFVFERDRRRYLAAHAQLRMLLSRRTGIAAGRLEFEEGPFGKPALSNSGKCSFNLSHSEDTAVVLIASRGEIGVDIEMLRAMPDALALADRNFSGEECRYLRNVELPHRDRAFLIGWTRKEACLKAIGSGLSIAPATFTAGLVHEPRTVRIATPQGTVRVGVESLCHQRSLIAWAWVEPHLEA